MSAKTLDKNIIIISMNFCCGQMPHFYDASSDRCIIVHTLTQLRKED